MLNLCLTHTWVLIKTICDNISILYFLKYHPFLFCYYFNKLLWTRKWISSKNVLVISRYFLFLIFSWSWIKSPFTPPVNKLLKTTLNFCFLAIKVCVGCGCEHMWVLNEHLTEITHLSYKVVWVHYSCEQVLSKLSLFFRWTELCPMIEARKNHGLVFVKDKIFAVGGQNGLGMWH